jgi:hypothetical protein
MPRNSAQRPLPLCPDGNRQRQVEIVGFRLKGEDYLQLRVVALPSDRGVCQATFDEYSDRVLVEAVACLADQSDPEDRRNGRLEEMECPLNHWLDMPLGDQIVADRVTGLELPLCIPGWDRGARTQYVPRPAGVLWPPEKLLL